MIAAAEPPDDAPPGILANNYMFVYGLQCALSKTDTNISAVVKSIGVVIRDGCWRQWVDHAGKVVRWNAADFRLFLTSKRPEGCETPIHVLERILRDTDVWEAFQGLIRGERGAPEGHAAYPPRNAESGQFSKSINRDIITVNGGPSDVIASLPSQPVARGEVPPVPGPKPARDYSREAPTGTSVSYGLRRLSVQAPEAYKLVVSGEKSVNRAMIEAGLRVEEFTIPVEPEKAARRILKRFKGEDLVALVRGLASHAGLEMREATDAGEEA